MKFLAFALPYLFVSIYLAVAGVGVWLTRHFLSRTEEEDQGRFELIVWSASLLALLLAPVLIGATRT